MTVKRCTECSGGGRVESLESLKVTLPRGVATGTKLKIGGKGNAPRTGAPAGDLFVIINVDDHPLFQRRGADLFVEVPITIHEAALGADVQVPTVEGTTTIRVPTGTESGKVFRLGGRGLPALKGGRKGDLHLRVVVEVPHNLDAKATSALEKFANSVSPDTHPLRQKFSEQLKERT